MPIETTKFAATIVVGASLLTGCATGAKQINLPLSSLNPPTESVGKSAIAFQASDGTCNKSGFKISPQLADGNYGPAESIEISSSTFKLKSKSLTQTKFASSTKQLYVKTMPPGKYVITRIWCYDSNGQRATSYFTKADRIDIFGEFEVDPGQTNYIGALQVSKSYSGKAPTFTIRDKSADAQVFFDEHYVDKTAPMQTKLAQRKGPGVGSADMATILKLLEDAKARVDAKKAAEDAADE